MINPQKKMDCDGNPTKKRTANFIYRIFEKLLSESNFWIIHRKCIKSYSCWWMNYIQIFIKSFWPSVGSSDARCARKQEEIPLRCDPGQPLDPRCPNPTPTAEPATYLPPFSNAATQTTKRPIFTSPPTPFSCSPNSLDPRCRTIEISTKTFGSVSTAGLSKLSL